MKELRRVYPNKGVEAEYRKKLGKLVNNMSKSVMYWLLADWGGRTAREMAIILRKRIKQWDKVFGKEAEKIALWFVKSVKKHTEFGMKSAFREAGYKLKADVPKNTELGVEIENKALIKSIPEKYFTGIETIAMMALLYGWSRETLADEIQKRYRITIRRTKLIAADQTHKTTELFKRAICIESNIWLGKWVYTWRSEKPRESHVEMDGTIFDLRKGCYNREDNEYIFPAQKINCYHKDTEVMTKNGFKKFINLSPDDKILTLNPETKDLEYANIKNFFAKKIDNIVHIKGKSLDMAVDPNHTFFTYKKIEHKKGKYSLEPRFIDGIENLGKMSNKFFGSSKWIGEEPEFIFIGNKKIKTDVFCKFMGYYLSEGHIDHKICTTAVHITQFKHLDKMYDDIKGMGFHKNKGCLRLYDKEIVEYLRKFGYSYEKYVPDEILKLSSKYIRVFLDAYALGDGSLSKKIKMYGNVGKTNQKYYTSSKRMMDTLCECIIKSGKGVSVKLKEMKGKSVKFKNGEYHLNTDMYWITEKENVYMQLKTANMSLMPYNDFVYDIEVDKNHTLLVKYGSCIHWNSNCKCDFKPVIVEFEDDLRKLSEIGGYSKNVARGSNY